MSWFERLFFRRRIYGDLSDELRAHLEERADELAGQGVSRREAMARARREFGNLTSTEERGREV